MCIYEQSPKMRRPFIVAGNTRLRLGDRCTFVLGIGQPYKWDSNALRRTDRRALITQRVGVALEVVNKRA